MRRTSGASPSMNFAPVAFDRAKSKRAVLKAVEDTGFIQG